MWKLSKVILEIIRMDPNKASGRNKFQLPSSSLNREGRLTPPPSGAFLALDLAPKTDSASKKITQQIAVVQAPREWLSWQ